MPALHAAIDERVLIRCAGLAIGRQGRILADGLEWQVEPGSWWWIEGANGSGKSTLLATLVGELRPLGGSLTVHPWIADGGILGMVMQHDELLPTLPLSVAEYVACGRPGGRGDAASEAAAIADLGLDGARSYWALSGGQRQRARIARALGRRPALLVLDEPFNHLDPSAVALCLGACETRRAAGLAVICVAHRPPSAASSGRIILGEGRCQVEKP